MAEIAFTPTAKPVLAVKTLAAIKEALEADQGNRFRELLRETMPTAEDAYSSSSHGFRTHLGASFIGRECARELWYTFHWATAQKHEGRMLRLFNRGHLEEPRFVALLRMIGCRVWQYDANKKQFRVSYYGGHYGGSLDGVVEGCPDDPRPILTEFKTHSDKSFAKLQSHGVRVAKFPHYVQMQTYMGGFQLPRALYLAVNKNDDDIHAELVDYDREIDLKHRDRAHDIIFTNSPPRKLSETPGWFTCKTCDHKLTCHYNGLPERNCRTCVYSRVCEDGTWTCAGHAPPKILDKAAQLAACPDYRFKPDC